MSCPRWRADQSTSTSVNAAVCETVAIYFRSFVLVIDFGDLRDPSTSFTLAETQSQPRKWPNEFLVAQASTNLLACGIVSGLFAMRSSMADFVSGVRIMGTFRCLFPVISMRSSLKI